MQPITFQTQILDTSGHLRADQISNADTRHLWALPGNSKRPLGTSGQLLGTFGRPLDDPGDLQATSGRPPGTFGRHQSISKRPPCDLWATSERPSSDLQAKSAQPYQTGWGRFEAFRIVPNLTRLRSSLYQGCQTRVAPHVPRSMPFPRAFCNGVRVKHPYVTTRVSQAPCCRRISAASACSAAAAPRPRAAVAHP